MKKADLAVDAELGGLGGDPLLGGLLPGAVAASGLQAVLPGGADVSRGCVLLHAMSEAAVAPS